MDLLQVKLLIEFDWLKLLRPRKALRLLFGDFLDKISLDEIFYFKSFYIKKY